MARFKKYSYSQGKFIPVNFAEQIQPDTFEFALNYIIDNELDLSIFEQRFINDDTGAPAFDPAILLKIILLGYSRGIISSREIARACCENVVFMAISADSRPHFTTIAGFIASMEVEVAELFANVLFICAQQGLIGENMFAIDGCKISSNCSKEASGTRKDFLKKKKKLEKSIRFLLRKHKDNDDDDLPPSARSREKQAIAGLQSKVRKLKKWLAENEDKLGARGQPLKSNMVDNDSAKMASSHGVIQGYNAQAAVDAKHQVIVDAQAFGQGPETHLLKPMIAGVRRNFARISPKADVFFKACLTADSGYHSESNFKMLAEQSIEAYIADRSFRKRDVRYASAVRHKKPVDRKKTQSQKRYFQPADFKYDRQKRKLICPAGKELYLKNRNFKDTKGLRGVSYMAKKSDCRICKIRAKCLRKPHTAARQVTLFFKDQHIRPPFTEKMIKRFDSAQGRFIYSRRIGTVEPVFAHICHTLKMSRFTLRGLAKVNIQWKLYCIVHNLKKIHRYAFAEP